MQKGANGEAMAIFMALESALCSIVGEMGSHSGLGQVARFLKDHPDNFPMFSTVSNQVPSTEHLPGAPKGNKNAFKHGHYTAEAIASRREIAKLLRDARALVKQVS